MYAAIRKIFIHVLHNNIIFIAYTEDDDHNNKDNDDDFDYKTSNIMHPCIAFMWPQISGHSW